MQHPANHLCPTTDCSQHPSEPHIVLTNVDRKVALVSFRNSHAIVQVEDLELSERGRQGPPQFQRVALQECRGTVEQRGTPFHTLSVRAGKFQPQQCQIDRPRILPRRGPLAHHLLQHPTGFPPAEGKGGGPVGFPPFDDVLYRRRIALLPDPAQLRRGRERPGSLERGDIRGVGVGERPLPRESGGAVGFVGIVAFREVGGRRLVGRAVLREIVYDFLGLFSIAPGRGESSASRCGKCEQIVFQLNGFRSERSGSRRFLGHRR
mmetsp:Transcript_58225/g.123507  ORF Transcript_58225/g.123507 Transcript_58225/m.123507 type:complete len:264 (+) Transcript_58225:68-859(+)